MIYVFYGDDGFSAHEALAELLERVGPPEVRDANVTRLEAGEFSLERFGAAAMVVPFLADRRLVIVRGLLATADSSRTQRGRGRAPSGGAAPDPAAGLVELLEQLPPTTDAVFLDGKLTPSNPLRGTIRKLGPERATVREFPALRRDALAAWVRQRAEDKGARIEQQAVALLVEHVGPDLWTMDAEVEKLAIYRAEGPITAEDVEALVSHSRESSVFELVDAVMEHRPDAALAALTRLLNGGATGPYIVSMVARQARMVAIAQELTRSRVAQGEWGKRLGTSSDFVVRKVGDQARRFSTDAVRRLYGLLLEADLAMKTGGATDELALTELIARARAQPLTHSPAATANTDARG